MRAPREWRIEYGTEWATTVAELVTGERFRENLLALQDAISYDPFRHSRPLIPEVDTDRYATTKDVASGWRMVVFFRVNRREMTCTLEWLALEAL